MLMDEEVAAWEHLQRERPEGFLAPGLQLLVTGAVLHAAQHVQRALQGRPLAVGVGTTQQEVGAQGGQGQAHQLGVGQHFLWRALKLAQLADQLGVALGLAPVLAIVVLAPGRCCGAAGEQGQWRRAAQRLQLMGKFKCQQGAQAMAEQRVRGAGRQALFGGQLPGQGLHVGVQWLGNARATPGQFHRAHLQPRRQLAPPAAVDHGAGPGIRQAQQVQCSHWAAASAIFWRRLSGRMSVQTSSM